MVGIVREKGTSLSQMRRALSTGRSVGGPRSPCVIRAPTDMAFGSIRFRCPSSGATGLGKVGLRVRHKRALKVMKGAKDKGAAFVGRLLERCPSNAKVLTVTSIPVRRRRLREAEK